MRTAKQFTVQMLVWIVGCVIVDAWLRLSGVWARVGGVATLKLGKWATCQLR